MRTSLPGVKEKWPRLVYQIKGAGQKARNTLLQATKQTPVYFDVRITIGLNWPFNVGFGFFNLERSCRANVLE